LQHKNDCRLTQKQGYWLGEFSAMASPCQLLLDNVDEQTAWQLFDIAVNEVKRIEVKFSRYRPGSVISQLNNANGKAVNVDDETAKLLDLAQLCFQLSDGMFDISAGVLGRLWHFKQQEQLPQDADIQKLRQYIGWQKAEWQAPNLRLPAGMQLDLGGIGKEYAVDRVAALLQQQTVQLQTSQQDLQNTTPAFLVNLGGDLFSHKLRANGESWKIAIENPNHRSIQNNRHISLKTGGLASSGDSQRFIDLGGKRYSHILNPHTGYPITDGPRQVTVYAQNCVQAGILATIALLHGKDAQDFLEQQDCLYWLY